MKVRILNFLIVLIFIFMISMYNLFYVPKNKSILKTTKVNKENNNIAIMLETEKRSGEYELSLLKEYPKENNFIFNQELSYCEKGSNITYLEESKEVKVSTKLSDKCYFYFDMIETGAEDDPYLIMTIEDLVDFSQNVRNGNTYAGKYFKLTKDLDFTNPTHYDNANRLDYEDYNDDENKETLIKELQSGKGFKPIGNGTYRFAGTFDGDNHRIDNLYITNNQSEARLGLFERINNVFLR